VSEQLDTKALRALIHEYDELRPHLSREPEMSRASAIIYRLADAAPDLLDAADERDALRARVAELERGEIKWAETCDDLRKTLEVSGYVKRHDDAMQRAHAAEARVASLEGEVGRVREALARERFYGHVRCTESNCVSTGEACPAAPANGEEAANDR